MSWQERIERYKKEQVQLQGEAERKHREEQEQERQRRIEAIKPLLQALEDLKCQEMLTQIRDEVWKLGEVIVSPALNKVTHESPIEASAVLRAEWSKRCMVSHPDGGLYEFNGYIDVEEMVTFRRFLKIKVFLEGENIGISIGGDSGESEGSTSVDRNTYAWLEEQLVKDCTRREVPYNQTAKEAQEKYANRKR